MFQQKTVRVHGAEGEGNSLENMRNAAWKPGRLEVAQVSISAVPKVPFGAFGECEKKVALDVIMLLSE